LKLEKELKEKNTYLGHYHSETARQNLDYSHAAKTSRAFAFDKVNEMDGDPEEMNQNKP
jgi:hypothetical protein